MLSANRHYRLLLFLLLFLSIPLAAFADISSVLSRGPVLDPNLSLYPDASLADRSTQLDAPAGKNGFITSKNGHFYYGNGKRARFFGINLAKETVFISKPEIDRLTTLFARSGINLVRIHHIDDITGIIDPKHPGTFRADKLDLIDYWIARLKAKGIYICLDLNDYRTFRAEEGAERGEALGRGAKPYAVFDQRLIELQQSYAKQFLVEHVNPYTNLSYAGDPAIAMLEIYDENGLFIRRDDWQGLVEPYKTLLGQQWNAWLRYRYGTTAALKTAWTDRGNACALADGESLELATVKLPVMTLLSNPPQGVANPLQAPARVSDGALFAYETQVNYLQMMRRYLRDIGVKIPITAVGAQEILPDMMATAQATDYIGINYYWDHPSFDTGNDWQMPAYFSLQNPLAEDSIYTFPADVSQSRMQGKPLVVRELGYCYPNPYRGVGMIEAAAYGAFLDLDALILFTYDAGATKRNIGYFDIHLDPLRWGLVAQASRLFLSGEVQPSQRTIGIGYSAVDAFTWKTYTSPLYYLSAAAKVVNYTDASAAHPYDLLISSGRSCGSTWLGEKLLLFANQNYTDLHFQGVSPGMDAKLGYKLQTGNSGVYPFIFSGVGYDAGGKKTLSCRPCYVLKDLQAKKLQPVATYETQAMGFIDPRRKIICFRNLNEDVANRVALDALRDWDAAPVSHDDLDQNRWRADTGQIDRHLGTRLMRVDTPTIQVLAGDLGTPGALRTSMLSLTTPTQLGTLVAETLDGKSFADSTRFLLKMTSRASNENTAIARVDGGPKPYRLTNLGTPSIHTDGKSSPTPTRVVLNGKPLLDIGIQDGTFEYLVEGNRALLYIDTGDISVTLPVQPKTVRCYLDGKIVNAPLTGTTFTVPTNTLYTEIVW